KWARDSQFGETDKGCHVRGMPGLGVALSISPNCINNQRSALPIKHCGHGRSILANGSAAIPRIASAHARWWRRSRRASSGNMQCSNFRLLCLFDHFVSACEHRWRDSQTDRLGGHEIDDQLELRGLLDRQVGRIFSLEDAADVNTGKTTRIA